MFTNVGVPKYVISGVSMHSTKFMFFQAIRNVAFKMSTSSPLVLESMLNIKSFNNMFISYHDVGMVPSHSLKSLLLV